MNSFLISTLLLGSLAFINAGAQQFPDLASMLRRYDLSVARNLAMKENYAHKAEEKDDIVEGVKNALLSSMLEGEGGLLAAVMDEEDDGEAVAQFRFIRRLVNRFRQSDLGRQLEQGIKARLCQQQPEPEK